MEFIFNIYGVIISVIAGIVIIYFIYKMSTKNIKYKGFSVSGGNLSTNPQIRNIELDAIDRQSEALFLAQSDIMSGHYVLYNRMVDEYQKKKGIEYSQRKIEEGREEYLRIIRNINKFCAKDTIKTLRENRIGHLYNKPQQKGEFLASKGALYGKYGKMTLKENWSNRMLFDYDFFQEHREAVRAVASKEVVIMYSSMIQIEYEMHQKIADLGG